MLRSPVRPGVPMLSRLPTLAARPNVCIAMLCLLYAVQGMSDKFVRVGLKNYLVTQGVSTAAIGGLIAAISWPWALKWVWGPILDRFSHSRMGRRRPWILLAGSGMCAMLALLLGVELATGRVAASIRLLAVMVLSVNLFAAMLDVAVDATAIELLPEGRRGLANGLMRAAMAIGSFLGGQVLGLLLINRGLATAVAAEIGILLVILVAPLLLRERSGDAMVSLRAKPRAAESQASPHSARQVFAALARVMRIGSVQRGAAFAFLSLMAHGVYLVVWPIFLRTGLGWTPESLVLLEGGWAVPFEIGGALLGGVLASRAGAKRATVVSTLLMAAVWLAHAVVPLDQPRLLSLLYLLDLACYGLLSVSMASLFMAMACTPIAATQFSVFMALLNLSQGAGSSLAGLFASLDRSVMFAVFAAGQAAIAVLLWRLDPHAAASLTAEPEAEGRSGAEGRSDPGG